MERQTDRATVIVVLVALPFLLLSAAILVRALTSVRSAPEIHTVETEPPSSPRPAFPAEPAAKTSEAEKPIEQKSAEPKEEPQTAAQGVKETKEAQAAPARPAAAPLADLYDREAYQALRELKALVESQAWAEAARLIMSFDPAGATGIAPWIGDSSRAVSLRVAARLAHTKHPQIRQALGEQYETLATLRVAEAIRSADAAAIELATAQFLGARATAKAHQWLGDETLASGRFASAIGHYRAALHVDASLRGAVEPRMQLADAMLGREGPKPTDGPVEFGERTLSSADFERLVADLRARVAAGGSRTTQNELHSPPPGVSRYQSRLRGTLEGLLPPSNRKPTPTTLSPRVQATIHANVGYLATAQHLVAYDFTAHKQLWRSETSGTRHARAADFAFHVAEPLVHRGRVLARLVREQEPRLCCFDAATGDLVWTTDPRDGETIVAGPVITDMRLMVVSQRKQAAGRRTYHVCVVDAGNGGIGESRELLPTNDDRSGAAASLVSHDSGLAAAIGDLLVGIGADGGVEWIRSGHESTRGTMGIAGEAVLVATDKGVQAIAARDGQELWRVESKELAAAPRAASGLVLTAAREAAEVESPLRLTWLDAANGKTLATASAANPSPAERVELVLPVESRLFMLVSRERGADLDIVELEPATSAAESRF